MGQYYRGCILKEDYKKYKTENGNPIEVAISPYLIDNNGAKLMEHSWLRNKYVGIYAWLLSEDGGYFGRPFVWSGDYADDFRGEQTLFDLADEFCDADWCGSTLVAKNKMCRELIDTYEKQKPTMRYLVNLDKKVYMDLTECGEIHPLPLLCADGNGRGGGDYWGSFQSLVGTWAFDHIGFTNEFPQGYQKDKVIFSEE